MALQDHLRVPVEFRSVAEASDLEDWIWKPSTTPGPNETAAVQDGTVRSFEVVMESCL